MAKDLDRMSFKELQELELKLKKAKASAEDRTRAEVRTKVEALIAGAGFKVSDIFGGRGGKGGAVRAHRNGLVVTSCCLTSPRTIVTRVARPASVSIVAVSQRASAPPLAAATRN